MHYIVFDLEWNQPYTLEPNMIRRSGFPFIGEIIQIGAVKLDESLQIVDQFEVFITPKFLPIMHHSVEKLTHITMDKLRKEGISFRRGCEKFLQFIGPDGILVSWGPDDIEMLLDNALCHNVHVHREVPWFDAQSMYANTMHNSTQQYALQKAMEEMQVKAPNLQAHNGLHDAICTAMVCQRFPFEKALHKKQEKHGKQRCFYGLSRHEHKIFESIVTMPRIFRQSNRAKTTCPICKEPLHLDPIVGVVKHRFLSIGACQEHGTFGVHWYVGKSTSKHLGKRYFVSKMVTNAPLGLRELYARKR